MTALKRFNPGDPVSSLPPTFYPVPPHRRGVDFLAGAILTEDGFVRGSVSIEDGIIVGVSKQRPPNPLAKGVVIPAFTNAHTHVADAIVREELTGSLEDIVAPPHGLKHPALARGRGREARRPRPPRREGVRGPLLGARAGGHRRRPRSEACVPRTHARSDGRGPRAHLRRGHPCRLLSEEQRVFREGP